MVVSGAKFADSLIKNAKKWGSNPGQNLHEEHQPKLESFTKYA
jgi:hypothetical protein